jgi:RimJ/RimL family protein N-acetyltransferase
MLITAVWGQGYGTDAGAAVRDEAFEAPLAAESH